MPPDEWRRDLNERFEERLGRIEQRPGGVEQRLGCAYVAVEDRLRCSEASVKDRSSGIEDRVGRISDRLRRVAHRLRYSRTERFVPPAAPVVSSAGVAPYPPARWAARQGQPARRPWRRRRFGRSLGVAGAAGLVTD